MLFEDEFIFFLGPFAFDDAGIEVVEPALAALLGGAMREDAGNARPRAWTILSNEIDDKLVFFRCEWAFLDIGIEAFLPACGYLGRTSVGKV